MIIPAYNTIYSRVNTSGAAGSFEYTPIDNNYSMEFDGTNYIDVGNPTELQITGALTISFWFKSSSTSDQTAITKDNLSSRCFGVWTNTYASANTISFLIWSSGVLYSVESASNYNDGNWHNVICIFTPSTSIQIYVDGSLDGSNTTSIPSTIDNDPVNFVIGSLVSSGVPLYNLNGSIDEVAAWNSVLSEGTIEAIYNTTNDNPGKVADLSETPEGTPTAWYRFE
jgi:hypothetical protein